MMGVNIGGLLTYGGELRIVVDTSYGFYLGTVLMVFQMSGSSTGQFSEIEWGGQQCRKNKKPMLSASGVSFSGFSLINPDYHRKRRDEH